MRLSPTHGLNPAIPHCFLCGKPKNEVILAGRLPQDVEAPKGAVWNMEPCDECKSLMAQGIILISVRNGEKGNNPYRTGGFVVIREEAFSRIFNGCDDALEKRVAFLPDEVWDKVGLPR